MNLVIQNKGNKKYKITIDCADNEIRLKLKAGDDKNWPLAIFFATELLKSDFSKHSVLRGRFNNPKTIDSLLLQVKNGSYPIEIRAAENGFPYLVRER